MKPLYHFISSALLALVILFIFRDWLAGLIALLAGVFIDLDHLIDYWSLKPAHPFSPIEFLKMEKYEVQKKYIFVFLHGYEWIFLLFALSWRLNFPLWLGALTASVALHLLLDTVNNIFYEKNDHILSYFFLFRLLTGFKKLPYENNR